MKKLVLVHGRAQEGKDPNELKWNWVQALKEGLRKSDLPLPLNDSEIVFPYYGDLLDRLVYGMGKNDAAPSVITRGRPDDVEELRFKLELVDAMRKKVGLTDDQVREVSDDPTLEKGPLNWRWVQAILRSFDQHVPGLSGATVNLFTNDVFMYFRRPGVRDEIDGLVRPAIPNGQECILVAHSLGTLVAYSILRRESDVLKVPLYVTLGAPLALSVIQEAFNPLRYPPCVGRWYNAMDERDPVALYPLESPHFNITPKIENKKNVDNFTSNRHGIAGYLTDEDVAKKIYDALVA
jgi:hypothetical protein